MMSSTFMIRALQFLLSISFLVIIHELGHFTFARIFKVRVEKFYLFYNPYFSLFRMKKLGGKWRFKFFARNVEEAMVEKRDSLGNVIMDEKGKPEYRLMTDEERMNLSEDDWRREPDNMEWGIGWLPLGGYCSIAGMVDETTGADGLPQEPQPWEYRSKPTWQRLPIIVGGVLVNFVAALIIYGAILFHWGETYLPLQNAQYGLQYSKTMIDNGFEQGDKILQIEGQPVERVQEVVEGLLIDGKREVRVQRGEDTIVLTMPQNFAQQVLAAGEQGLIDFRFPFVVDSVMPSSAAINMGIEKGDRVVGVGEVEVDAYQDAVAQLQKYACDSVSVMVERGDERLVLRGYLGDEAKLGVYAKDRMAFLQTEHKEYGFWASIPAGVSYGWNTLVNYVKQFKLVFTKEGAKQLGGFATIGSLFAPMWDWYSFWLMTAFLSVILAFMNIIPIPGLDGGHMMFLLWEMITGKKPGDKFLERANTVGFWLLLALLIYANFNDIIRFLL